MRLAQLTQTARQSSQHFLLSMPFIASVIQCFWFRIQVLERCTKMQTTHMLGNVFLGKLK